MANDQSRLFRKEFRIAFNPGAGNSYILFFVSRLLGLRSSVVAACPASSGGSTLQLHLFVEPGKSNCRRRPVSNMTPKVSRKGAGSKDSRSGPARSSIAA